MLPLQVDNDRTCASQHRHRSFAPLTLTFLTVFPVSLSGGFLSSLEAAADRVDTYFLLA